MQGGKAIVRVTPQYCSARSMCQKYVSTESEGTVKLPTTQYGTSLWKWATVSREGNLLFKKGAGSLPPCCSGFYTSISLSPTPLDCLEKLRPTQVLNAFVDKYPNTHYLKPPHTTPSSSTPSPHPGTSAETKKRVGRCIMRPGASQACL